MPHTLRNYPVLLNDGGFYHEEHKEHERIFFYKFSEVSGQLPCLLLLKSKISTSMHSHNIIRGIGTIGGYFLNFS